MITKWAYRVLKMQAFTESENSSIALVKLSNGTMIYASPYKNSNNTGTWPAFMSSDFNPSSSAGIKIGTGTTSPTDEDYNLEAVISSGVSSANVTSVKNYDNDNVLTGITFLIPVTNTSSENITVSEIGMFEQVRGNTTKGATYSGSYYYFLVDRTLLSSPVTIPPSETATIEYTITF